MCKGDASEASSCLIICSNFCRGITIHIFNKFRGIAVISAHCWYHLCSSFSMYLNFILCLALHKNPTSILLRVLSMETATTVHLLLHINLCCTEHVLTRLEYPTFHFHCWPATRRSTFVDFYHNNCNCSCKEWPVMLDLVCLWRMACWMTTHQLIETRSLILYCLTASLLQFGKCRWLLTICETVCSDWSYLLLTQKSYKRCKICFNQNLCSLLPKRRESSSLIVWYLKTSHTKCKNPSCWWFLVFVWSNSSNSWWATSPWIAN